MPRSSSNQLPLREEQRALTRERIVEGARDCFAKRGYSATTVDDIVAAAGTSRATFYLHFRSKVDLIDAWYEDYVPDVESYYQRLDGILSRGSRDELRAWILDAVLWVEDNTPFSGVLEEVKISERASASGNGEVNEHYLHDPISHMPEYRARWGKSRQVEASLRLVMMVTMYSNVVLLWTRNKYMPTVDRTLMVETLTDVWSAALTPDPGSVDAKSGANGS